MLVWMLYIQGNVKCWYDDKMEEKKNAPFWSNSVHDLLQQLCNAWTKDTEPTTIQKLLQDTFPSVLLFHINLWLAEKGDSDLKALTMFTLESWEINDLFMFVYLLISDVISISLYWHILRRKHRMKILFKYHVEDSRFHICHVKVISTMSINQALFLIVQFMGEGMMINVTFLN